jgi:DNA-binding NarL/FixJ family response regulator
MSGKPVNVLVVDDDYYVREAITALVSRDGRTRLWGANPGLGSALDALASKSPLPDVILLDIRLAEGERAGVEGISALRRAHPGARILLTSVDSDDDVVLAGVRAGADGFVCKSEAAEQVVTAIVRVAQGHFVLSPTIAERLLGEMAELGRYAAEVLQPGNGTAGLTENVRKTLYLYAICGLTANQIADELQVSPHTVHSRIKSAFAAIGASGKAEAFKILVEGEQP